MIALVTGASSGIGKDIAIELAERGYDIIAVARNIQRLDGLKKEIESNFMDRKVHIKTCEISSKEQCKSLYNDVKRDFGTIDILVNNAGFGLCGEFVETDLDKEISMIETNVTGLHILTKLFLKDMVENNSGYIMNVASIAGFMPGPLMATYYSTRAYVLRLTQAIRHELFMKKSKVRVSCLCPGPVDTNFNNTAEVKFALKGADSKFVAKYAVVQMLGGRELIMPGLGIGIVKIASKLLPDRLMGAFCYFMQKKKIEK